MWQIIISTVGRRPMFRDEATRRRAVRTAARVLGARLVLFSFADDHLHADILAQTERDAGTQKGALLRALAHVAAVRLEGKPPRRVESRAHLERHVRYFVRQPEHHGLRVHPALWSGSAFADLVGARVVPGMELQLFQQLPRWTTQAVLAEADIQNPIPPAERELVNALGPGRLATATASAACLGPVISGRTAATVDARRVIARLGTWAGMRPRALREAMSTSRQTFSRINAAPSSPTLARATLVQLNLEEAVRDLPDPTIDATHPSGQGRQAG